MSKETPKVAREVRNHDSLSPEQEGGRTLSPPAFQLHANPAQPPAQPPAAPPDSPAAPKNETGMPDQLKAGVEQLSGHDMSDVRVHYNSDQPAQMQAHAYAQGSDIHIAPGQEQHLPHEAWHVAQQKQGRVQANTQLKGIGINDDTGLEREADVMGAKAAQMQVADTAAPLQRRKLQDGAVQRIVVQIVPELPKPEKEDKSENKKDFDKLKVEDDIQELTFDDWFDSGKKTDSFGDEPIIEDIDDFGYSNFNSESESNSGFGSNSNFNFGSNSDFNFGSNSNFNFGSNSNSNFGSNSNFDFGMNSESKSENQTYKPLFFQDRIVEENPLQNDLYPFNIDFFESEFDFLPSFMKEETRDISKEIFIFGQQKSPEEKLNELKELSKEKKSTPPMRIGKVHIIGRPKKLYSSSMGDHTTAFGVHTAGLKVQLKGATAIDAAIHMQSLALKSKELPGYKQLKTDKQLEKRVTTAETSFDQSLQSLVSKAENAGEDQALQSEAFFVLQTCIENYLEFREMIPLSAINVAAKSPALAGKGKGEAQYIEKLTDWESKSITPTPMELYPVISGTFDPSAVAMTICESKGDLLKKMAPGLEIDQSIEDLIRLFVTNHLESLKMAFPGIGWLITIDEKGYEDKLCNEVLEKVVERAKVERSYSISSQIKLGEQEERMQSDWSSEKSSIRENKELDWQEKHGKTKKRFRFEEPKLENNKYFNDWKNNIDRDLNWQKGIEKNQELILKECENLGSKLDIEKIDKGLFSELEKAREEEKENQVRVLGELEKREDENVEKEERAQLCGTSLKFDFGGKIMEIKFAGRPNSPFGGGTMGAHTTSWIVIQDWISQKLKGRTVAEAIDVIDIDLFEKMKSQEDAMLDSFGDKSADQLTKLIGYDIGLIDEAKDTCAQYILEIQEQPAGTQKLMLQELINHLMTYINMIPGTTMNKGDTTGKGEAKHRKALMDRTKNGKAPFQTNVNGLFDIGDLPNGYGEDQKDILKDHHDDLIGEAYPIVKHTFSMN